MTSTIPYKPGNVILVRIKFAEDARTKKRPAVILTDNAYHDSRIDAIVVALSSKLENSYYGDYELEDWMSAGLPEPTRAKGVIQTIDRATIEKPIGALSDNDLKNLKESICDILGLRDQLA